MMSAIAGIFLILGLLAFSAFLVGREHLHDLRRDDEVPHPPFPRVHSH